MATPHFNISSCDLGHGTHFTIRNCLKAISLNFALPLHFQDNISTVKEASVAPNTTTDWLSEVCNHGSTASAMSRFDRHYSYRT
jgi:hypothetical protein